MKIFKLTNALKEPFFAEVGEFRKNKYAHA